MKALSFIFLFAHSLCANALCISLGEHCAPAAFLRDNQLRSKAYPFDWINTPFEGLYHAIEDDFKYILCDLKFRDYSQDGFNDHYGFAFVHEWRKEDLIADINGEYFRSTFPIIKAKYLRRIERFINACNGKEKVIFLRHTATKDQAIKLRDLLKIKYPILNFSLIILGADRSIYGQPWNIEGVTNFYDHSPSWESFVRKAALE